MHPLRSILSVFFLTVAVTLSSVLTFSGTAHAQEITPQVVNPLRQNEPRIQQQTELVSKKADELNNTSQTVQELQSKKQTLAQQLADEQKAISDLKQQVADKKAAQEAAAKVAAEVAQSQAPTYVPVGQGPMGSCGDNYYASYIYGMESGGHVVGNCNPTAKNAGGCLGIGQACPGSKLVAVCPNLDYACENAFFTDYANKYGGWAGSYAFWTSHGWW